MRAGVSFSGEASSSAGFKINIQCVHCKTDETREQLEVPIQICFVQAEPLWRRGHHFDYDVQR